MTENVIDGARSQSARTQWFITESGCLKESGGDSYSFTLSIQDTKTVLDLLERNRDLIAQKSLEAQEQAKL